MLSIYSITFPMRGKTAPFLLFTVCYIHNLLLAFARTHTHKSSPSLPHVQAAGTICPPALGTGRAQRSHTAQSHTSSPRAHRSQPDRWTLMAAWTVFEMACLKFDGTQWKQKQILIIQWLFLSKDLWPFLNLPFPLPAIWESPTEARSAPSPSPAC